jgi:hypothetical protein
MRFVSPGLIGAMLQCCLAIVFHRPGVLRFGSPKRQTEDAGRRFTVGVNRVRCKAAVGASFGGCADALMLSRVNGKLLKRAAAAIGLALTTGLFSTARWG